MMVQFDTKKRLTHDFKISVYYALAPNMLRLKRKSR